MQLEEQKPNLKSNSLGVSDIVFFVVAAAAPLGATLGATPAVFAVGGAGAPAIYLCASLILLLFAVGFAAMSKYVVSAGGFAELVKVGIGRVAGNAASGVALVAYTCMIIGIYGAFAAFNSELILSYTGIAVSWQVSILIAVVLVAVFGYLDVGISAKLLGILMILEVFILVIFDAAVIWHTPLSEINFSTMLPQSINFSGIGVALMFAFACFVGFESTTIYGEEAKNPRRTIPLATYISIGLIGVFYTLTTWCIGLAYSGQDVQSAAGADLVNFVFNANTKFVGAWSTALMQLLAVTSLFAVLLSFHNALCRYFFSLARSQFLFKALERVHIKHNSPHIASATLTFITVALIGAFMVAQADPIKHLYMWLVAVGTLGILILQTLGAIAVIAYFRKTKQGYFWQGLVAPSLGGIGLSVAAYLAVTNFAELSGANSGLASYLPWLIPIAACLGILNGTRKQTYLSIEQKSALI